MKWLPALLLLIACNQKTELPAFEKAPPPPPETLDSYFPVTDYVVGEIANIKTLFVNPLKITNVKGKIDSVWLDPENMQDEFKDFLTPVIDTGNMKSIFEEVKFEDIDTESYIFSYAPYDKIPDSLNLLRWDVYVSTLSQRVTSVNWAKDLKNGKHQQLVWNSGNSCKITELHQEKDEIIIDKEITIKWRFRE